MNNKIIHWVASLVLVGLPFVINSHAPWLDLTVGGILNAVYLTISHFVSPTQV